MITFSLALDPYLRDFFVTVNGGSVPVKLKKGSIVSIIIQTFSRKKSESTVPVLAHEGETLVYFPESKSKPPESYCVLTAAVKEMIVNAIREQFDLALFNTITKYPFSSSLIRDCIYQFMELYGIEDTEQNWLAVQKRHARLRSRLLSARRQKKFKKSHRSS